MTDTSRVSPFDDEPDVRSVTDVDPDEDCAAPDARRPTYAAGLPPADGCAEGWFPELAETTGFGGCPVSVGFGVPSGWDGFPDEVALVLLDPPGVAGPAPPATELGAMDVPAEELAPLCPGAA